MNPNESEYDWDAQTAVLQILASRSEVASAHAAHGLLWDSAAKRQILINEFVPRALADRSAKWSAEERLRLVSAMWVLDEDGYLNPAPSEVD